MSGHAQRLARIIFANLNDIEEWRLGNPALAAAKGYPREYRADLIDDWGIVFADFTLDAATHTLVCHEVNGPNGVGSDALTGDSYLRAQNEAHQAMRRAREFGYLDSTGRLSVPVVTIHAHQHWPFFRTGGEFYPRVEQFATSLERLLPDNEISLCGPNDPLGDEQISVLVGDVPALAENLRVVSKRGHFAYRGRPVVFAGNPNLLTELARIGRLRCENGCYPEADLRVFHAWRLTTLVNDKGLQQDLLQGTGVVPLRYFAADNLDEALAGIGRMLRDGPVVLKPNAGSGGAGVRAVVPAMTEDEIVAAVNGVISDCHRKYGEGVERTIFPLRGFEFVRSTGYPMEDGPHLWDLRIAVLFEPGKARAFPVSLRVAPQPFAPDSFHRDRDRWISNVSGRQVTLLKSGMDDEALSAVGMTSDLVELAMTASVKWTLKAWDRSVRDGGVNGTVYEDLCEARDRSFYPVEKFAR